MINLWTRPCWIICEQKLNGPVLPRKILELIAFDISWGKLKGSSPVAS